MLGCVAAEDGAESPAVVRLGFVLLTLFSFGTGLLLYIVLWVVMPEDEKRGPEDW